MRVLWISNSPQVASGYGVQTQIFTELMQQAGHEVVVFGFHGHQGAPLEINGIEVLPTSMDPWGQDVIGAHWSRYRPDVTVLLIDIWVYNAELLRTVPITAYAPVDHTPAPRAVIEKLAMCRNAWAYSRHGEREMRKAGIDPYYVPLAVRTDVYAPIDREKARELWNVPKGAFFAAMVAANRGFPSRKSFDKVFKAWGRFIKTHPDAVLYVHTRSNGQPDGPDLLPMAKFYEIPAKNLRFPDEYRLLVGEYSNARMNALYNAADVLLSPSMGEGFGVPAVEAQAAGCPVIVSDFTAQTELCFGGYKVPIHDDDLTYTPMSSEMASIRPSEILKGLEWAYEHRGDEALRKTAHEGAQDYDAKLIFNKFMLPSMKLIAEQDRDIVGARHTLPTPQPVVEAVEPAVDVEKVEEVAELVGEMA